MPKVPRNLIAAVLFTLAFVLNPAYVAGCGDEDAEPNFGEAQMLEVLEGLTVMGPYSMEEGDAQYEVELMLTQVGGADDLGAALRPLFAMQAYACGSRTFMQSAAACITSTTLPIEGALTLRRIDGDEPAVVVSDLAVRGEIVVFGTRLGNAHVSLDFEGGFAALVSDDGVRFDVDRFEAQNLGPDAIDLAVSAPAPAPASDAPPDRADPHY